MTSEKVVVTGATSFIGKYLVKALLDKDYVVYVVVRDISKLDIVHSNLHIVICDFKDFNTLADKIIAPVDIFYHLAWDGTRGLERNNAKKQQMNVVATMEAMKACIKLNCQTFIGIGSQAEYGCYEGSITENCPTKPETEYGKAKLEVYERGCKLFPQYNVKFIWARVFSIYGVGDYEGSLIMSVIKKMLSDEMVKLTTCNQNWDYLHVYDATRALIALISAPAGVYNIANGESHALYEFVLKIKGKLNSDSELVFGAIPYNTTGVVSLKPNVDKLKNATGWKPIVDFEMGIGEIIKEQGQEKWQKSV